MRKELSDSLGEQFPFFTYDTKIMDGWYNILKQLFTDIVSLNPPPEFHITDVRQKLGRLRVYFDGVQGRMSETIARLIETLAQKSITVCQICGEPGELVGSSFKTLCQEHHDERAKQE